MKLTHELLAELEAREKAATKAPWSSGELGSVVQFKDGELSDYVFYPEGHYQTDAEFTAAIRNHAKELIQSAKREARYRKALQRIVDECGGGSYHCVELAIKALAKAK